MHYFPSLHGQYLSEQGGISGSILMPSSLSTIFSTIKFLGFSLQYFSIDFGH